MLSLKPNEKDFNYRVEELETYISEVVDRGFEIGLHGGWEAYKDRNKLHNEKTRLEKTLNKKVEGYRNHYLLFKQPETWKMLHEEGFIYDSTLAFPDGVGFRNGLCSPFKPYDLGAGKPLDIIELPVAVMDRAMVKPTWVLPQRQLGIR